MAERILLADDEEPFRSATAKLLQHEGYECVCVADGFAAAKAMCGSPFDLLIADIRMPGNRDLELVRQVARHHIPTILITGYPSVETAVNAVELAVVSYLGKPVNFAALLEAVRYALSESLPARLRKLQRAAAPLFRELGSEEPPPRSAQAKDVLAQLPELSGLSKREQEVLEHLIEGCADAASIARRFQISPNTARNHIKSILRKTGVHSQRELMQRIIQSLKA